MNWSGGSKSRFQSKNSNQRKASSQQQARIPFIDNDVTIHLNNSGSSSQDLQNSLFMTPCFPKPQSSPNSNSLFITPSSYAKPSHADSQSNAVRKKNKLNIIIWFLIHLFVQYKGNNSYILEQMLSEKPLHKSLLGNKFSNITSGSGIYMSHIVNINIYLL
jgi:hypothetical protein